MFIQHIFIYNTYIFIILILTKNTPHGTRKFSAEQPQAGYLAAYLPPFFHLRRRQRRGELERKIPCRKMQEIASILDAALRCILTGRNIIPPSKTGAAPLVCRARGICALLCLKQYNTCTMQVCIEQREWLRFCSCVIAIDFFIYAYSY